jgi:hypothetical protein
MFTSRQIAKRKKKIRMVNKKQILSIIITLALIASVSAVFQVFDAPHAYAADDATSTVMVTGADGTTKNFTLTELEALPSVSMYGGFYQQNQKIGNNGLWTGVSVLTLCNQVGGITPDCTIAVTGQGTNTFTYEMINSGTNFNSQYRTYNNITFAPQNQTQPITVILAYRVNGTELPSSYQPAPRLVIVGPEGLLSDGSGGRGITQVTITGTAPVATPTPSPLPTPSPTASPSPSPSATQIVTPTPTQAATPTGTPTTMPTSTPAPTATAPTPLAASTASPTPQPTATATLPTPTPTISPTASPTPSPTPTEQPKTSPSAAPTPTAAPENNGGADQTTTYLIVAAVVAVVLVVALAAVMRTRKK